MKIYLVFIVSEKYDFLKYFLKSNIRFSYVLKEKTPLVFKGVFIFLKLLIINY